MITSSRYIMDGTIFCPTHIFKSIKKKVNTIIKIDGAAIWQHCHEPIDDIVPRCISHIFFIKNKLQRCNRRNSIATCKIFV